MSRLRLNGTSFVERHAPSKRGRLHARLKVGDLERGIGRTFAESGANAAVQIAKDSLYQTDLSPGAIELARTVLRNYGGLTPPSELTKDVDRRFAAGIEAAQDPKSRGGPSVIEREVQDAFDSRGSLEVPEVALKRALESAPLTADAATLVRDLLHYGERSRSGAYYVTPWDLRVGDDLLWLPRGAKKPVEVRVLEEKKGRQRVEVTQTFGGKLGGNMELPTQHFFVEERASKKRYWLDRAPESNEIEARDLQSPAVHGRLLERNEYQRLPPELAAKYQRAPYEYPFVDTLDSRVGFEVVDGRPQLRSGGEMMKAGDGVYYHLEVEPPQGEMRTFELEARIRSIDVEKKQVIVDEIVSPGRLRTRALMAGELGKISRESFVSERVAKYDLKLEDRVVTPYPTEPEYGGKRFAVRIGDTLFAPADDVLIGAKKARLLSMEQGKSGPMVWARFEGGTVRRLRASELDTMALDQPALAARDALRSPLPGFEVIRPSREHPFVLLDQERAYPGDLIVFDRGTPGEVPMVIDRIERVGKEDRVWVTEPVPLAEGGERDRHDIDLRGFKVTIRVEGWKPGTPEAKTKRPTFEILTRALVPNETDLIKSREDRLRSEKHGFESRANIVKEDTGERVRYLQLVKRKSPLMQQYRELDRERFGRPQYKFEDEPPLGVFEVQDLDLAHMRTYTTFPSIVERKLRARIRDAEVFPGDSFFLEHGKKKTPMKVVAIEKQGILVDTIEDDRLQRRHVTKAEMLFMFRDPKGGEAIEARRSAMLADLTREYDRLSDDLDEEGEGLGRRAVLTGLETRRREIVLAAKALGGSDQLGR